MRKLIVPQRRLIKLTLRRLIGGAIALLFVCQSAWGAITTDGAADGQGNTNTTCTTNSTLNLTTTNSNDVVIAFIWANRTNAQGSLPTPSSVSGATLGNFTFYAAVTASNYGASGDYFDLEIWYVVAASPVINEIITSTYSNTFDNCAISAQAFTGAKTSGLPFDTNSSLPASSSTNGNGTGKDNTGTIPSLSGLSTSYDKTVLLGAAAFSAGTNTNAQSAGGGFTSIHNLSPAAGAQFTKESTEYQTTESSSPQSGQTVAFNATWANWIMITAALVDATGVIPGGSSAPARMLLGVGQ